MGAAELGRDYCDGAAVFQEGDQGDCMYVIQTGSVKIIKSTPDGDVHIATLEEGEIFGEMALFESLPRSATATALGDTRLLTVDKKKFFANISRDPTLAFNILEAMSSRMRRINSEYSKLKNEKFEFLKVTLDLEQVCARILDEARQVVDADNGSVMLIDKDSQALKIVTAFGKERTEKIELRVGDGIAGTVLESGQAQMINNVSVSPLFKPGGPELTSIVCVPLILENRRLGVLNLSTSSEKIFSMHDLNLIKVLASFSTIAINSALSFEELKEATEALTQVVNKLSS
jgi:CRP/FNR family cyclic AMP-dependent transcriptional regulator